MPRSTKTSSRTPATEAAAPGHSGPAKSEPAGQSGPAKSEPAGQSGPAASASPVAGRRAGARAAAKGEPERAGEKASGARAPARGAEARVAAAADAFVVAQRAALLAERATYVRQADELKAQADSLASEHEPGDVQFDEEGGEGGTASVDRELDLLLSAQARGAVAEIDRALAKMDTGTYGRCEHCRQPIPEARLEALPHAALCVMCKAGGLASRR